MGGLHRRGNALTFATGRLMGVAFCNFGHSITQEDDPERPSINPSKWFLESSCTDKTKQAGAEEPNGGWNRNRTGEYVIDDIGTAGIQRIARR